jgi:hypothetical protein
MALEQKQITVRLPLWVYAALLAYKDQTGIAPATMVRSWCIFQCLMLTEGNIPSGSHGMLPPLLPPDDSGSDASEHPLAEAFRRYGLEVPDYPADG